MASQRRATVRDNPCPICQKLFSAQGISTHVKHCQRKSSEVTAADKERFKDLADALQNDDVQHRTANLNRYASVMATAFRRNLDVNVNAESSISASTHTSPWISAAPSPVPSPQQFEIPDDAMDTSDNFAEPVGPSGGPTPTDPPIVSESQAPQRNMLDILDAMIPLELTPNTASDQIRIEYHPSANKAPKVIPVNKYSPYYTKAPVAPLQKSELEPWHPFRTRLDFEIAELSLATHMNKGHIQTLLSLFEKAIASPRSFTISSAKELSDTWKLARTYRASGFVRKEYTVPYKGEDVNYEIYVRPLIDWCHELLRDPYLTPHFRWNAERHYKIKTEKTERMIGEPWTANTWWKIQDSLPDGASPFCIVLYADKTRLSTFGTAKAYPVMARCANLPHNVRNGSGVGGGRLVGWLPIVEENAGETGKKVYVNLKRVIWHEGFYEILLSVQKYATTGYHTKWFDKKLWLFFFVLILSADYEEQCVMALTRGSTSNFPCPVCLVPREELANITASYPLRTTERMSKIYHTSQGLNSKDKEAHLKDVGIRDVKNVFWMMNGTDVYSAISWDRLHAYHGGLFSDHLWIQFKEVVDELGKKNADIIDKQFDMVPRWSGLNHFSSVIKTGEFADGSKYEDMGKLIVFVSHNALASDKSERGYCLLKLIRSFIELDMFSSLTIHTDTTLESLGNEFIKFGEILDEYISLHPDKNWNFPKNHSHAHMIRDILEKGVTRNSNTKPNEKAHGILKLWYRFRTNFKDVAPQILRMNEEDLIAMIIRMAIDFADELDAQTEDLESEIASSHADGPSAQREAMHVTLGSPLSKISLGEFHESNKEDRGFNRFRVKVGMYLAACLNKRVRLNADDEITPYQLARVNYQSVIDWSTERDLVRVHHNFHGEARNDFVLLKASENEYIIGQLLTIFTISVDRTTHELAHVLPFDGSIDRRSLLSRRRDHDLRFIRVRARKRVDSVIVDLQCIERGSLLVSDHGNDPNDFIVIDVIDQDMWWRLKSVKLGTNVRL